MRYAKPQLEILDKALESIERREEHKGELMLRDSYAPFFYDATQCAYEADE